MTLKRPNDFAEIPAVIPWWTLNGTLTEAEACRQLDDLKAKQVREFFLYPNFGLEEPDFLTEGWFSFVRFLLGACKERGMRFWLYDELSWPSGSSGGRLCRDFPEYRMRTLRRSEVCLDPGESWKPDAAADYVWCGVFKAGKCDPIECEHTQNYRNETGGSQRLVLIEKILIEDHFFCSMGTSGTWNQPGVVDALNPSAVRAWMDFNYDPYRRNFSDELGKTIRGFFFDEPTMVSPFHTGDIPWTSGIEELFRQSYGYDCRTCYWALFECAPGFEQFRYDYWRLVSERFASSFAGQLSSWCEENNLMLSGHCWPEEPSCQRLMTTATGDIYKLQRFLHLPGTDFLYCENNYAEKAGMCPGAPNWARNLIYSAKHASSTARYSDVPHSICECSGICELGNGIVTPAVQKIAYDFLYAMGVSVMNPARPYDMSGFRKHVCAMDAGQPYWRHYGELFANYMPRMSQFNSKGRTDTHIAVLNPVSTKFAFSNITPDTSIRKEISPLNPHGDCAEAMLATLDALTRGHRDFELLFEEVVLESTVSENGELLAPGSAFQVVILPQCYALDDQVWCRLQEFTLRGGHLIVVGEQPTLPLRHGEKSVETQPFAVPVLACNEPNFAERLLSEISAVSVPDFVLTGEKSDEVLTQLRRDGEWQGLFLTNATPGRKCVSLSGRFSEQVKTMTDLQTGRVYDWSGSELCLENGASYLLTTDDAARGVVLGASLQAVCEIPADGWRICGSVRNTMRMRLSCKHQGEWVQIADNGAASFELDPDQISEIRLAGEFEICEEIPQDLRLWLDDAQFCSLVVNGKAVLQMERETLIDPRNVTVPIAEHCQIGKNRIEVLLAPSKWLKQRYGLRLHFKDLLKGCEPPFLLGSFRVKGEHQLGSLPQTLVAGSLEEQGFPQFCNELSVEREFVFDMPPVLRCELEIGESLLPIEVTINEVKLGARIWCNGSLDIPSGLLRAGKNSLRLRLCGDIWNLLERRWVGSPAEHTPFVLPKLKVLLFD